MNVYLFHLWLLTVENDWDSRLEAENPPNPYTFANKKKVNYKGYIEDLHGLALNYARRNRFRVWEKFFNEHLMPTKSNYSILKMKYGLLYGSDWIFFPETMENPKEKNLVLYSYKKRTFLNRVFFYIRSLFNTRKS